MHYESLFEKMPDTELEPWLTILPAQIRQGLDQKKYGDLQRWLPVVENLPEIKAKHVDLNAPAITITGDKPHPELKETLLQLNPWRKGPYNIHGVEIDTEWRSDWKWDRLLPHIQSLKGRRVLDVGCGNGYHIWRMLGADAELVIGIDPSPLFIMQFTTVKHFAGDYPAYVLPLGIEAMPENLQAFDTVFSMGVLYHRRSAIDHLMQLKACLKPGGELVLETLVIEGDENTVLVPRDRYAKMRNVWFIPSSAAMTGWLERCGFKNVRCVDECDTTIEEQRTTEWMPYNSLETFLDADDHSLTIEGYPAPRRAIFIADK